MTIKIMQTITNILSETGELERTSKAETYVITPTSGKVLKNIKTNRITRYPVCVNKKSKIADYVEIEDSSALL